MNQSNTLDFIQKMLQAKKLEAEALLMLVPEKTRAHLEVIGKELGFMLKDCLMDLFLESDKNAGEKPVAAHGVRKVDIGE